MYDVLSPDGYSISMDKTWETEEEAHKAMVEWIKRYESQGYYSMADRTKIPYKSIIYSCKIVLVKK